MAASDPGGASNRRFQEVSVALRSFLRRHYRLLANEHDDLLQQTLADLFESTRRTRAPLPDDELNALAYSILKRRIVDRFRRETRSVVENIDPAVVPEPHDEGTFDVRMHYRRLLRAVLLLVNELSPEQQALLLDEAPPVRAGRARSAAQRQQLRRLRESLRMRLVNEYGIRIDDESIGG